MRHTSKNKKDPERRTYKGVTYRSIFEANIARALVRRKTFYEKDRIEYVVPSKTRTYIPDWKVVTPHGKEFYIEAKGLFTRDDRAKHLLIKKQYPELDIRFLFYSNQKIGKTMRYSDWCEKYGIDYHIDKNGNPPKEWFQKNYSNKKVEEKHE